MKLSQKCYDNGEYCKLDFLCTIADSTRNELTIFSLKNFSRTKSILNLPVFIEENICMCSLPDNKMFCYGKLWWDKPETRAPYVSGLTFIINPDLTIEILKEGVKSYGSGGVFYDGNVYVFGGYNENGGIQKRACKYNFQENNWKIITYLPIALAFCSCIEYMGLILVGGANRRNTIFAYDIAGNSYLEILSGLGKMRKFCVSIMSVLILLIQVEIYTKVKAIIRFLEGL